MALMKSKEIPKGAVVIDEFEATVYAWDLVNNWKSVKDKWALEYGPFVLGGINALSGVLINSHYRGKLKLGNYGYFASVIPISVMPGIMTPALHRHLVSTDILLMKSACPICYEMRATAIQLGLGIAYPMVLAPLTGLMLASRYSTARMPSLFEGPRVVLKFVHKLTRPFTGTLTAIAIFQSVAAAILTHFEMKNNFTLRHKIEEIERRLIAERAERGGGVNS
ncbi:LOW QUALITY PROTEIN: transmembrane protein 126A-like [Manduca sexta]|uniref:LOW QUALITY PROTEIN: transmembrane protein 126A-like n=1 Tax=Manduca sexta TaxID=7130 RepID=UPI0018901545|nr:LOW QUALITY PROTEIN: transmembrane protein 126A-like [Manduca sexta]